MNPRHFIFHSSVEFAELEQFKEMVGWMSCISHNVLRFMHTLVIYMIDATVESLLNDHPHQRPSLLYIYDHILCDGQCFLFVLSLINDHPSNATNDRVRWNFIRRGRPLRVPCISKNHGWRFNVRSQWWIITMLRSDTFEVIQLL